MVRSLMRCLLYAATWRHTAKRDQGTPHTSCRPRSLQLHPGDCVYSSSTFCSLVRVANQKFWIVTRREGTNVFVGAYTEMKLEGVCGRAELGDFRPGG